MAAKRKRAAVSRRGFLAAASAAGATVSLGRSARQRPRRESAGQVRIALIGAGVQGRVLLSNLCKAEGVRVGGVCDIQPYRASQAWRVLGRYGHDAEVYSDYRDLLRKASQLDAAVIATPDWVHAEQAIACMEAGLHVYCENEMSNDMEGARRMVAAARKTNRLLQVGLQRRSNPLYVGARRFLLASQPLGRITHVEAHWHCPRTLRRAWPKKLELHPATLRAHGYGTMERLYNWRWYRKFSGGPLATPAGHQLDVLSWFLGRWPTTVQAVGGHRQFEKDEWPSDASVLLTWQGTNGGTDAGVRGVYQVLNTTSHGTYFETFVGDEAAMVVSENPHVGTGVQREGWAPIAAWERADDGPLRRVRPAGGTRTDKKSPATFWPGEIERVGPSGLPIDRTYVIRNSAGPPHRRHVENFLAAVREPHRVKLNAPGEVGLAGCVVRRAIQQAMETRCEVILTPEQFDA